MYYGLLLIGGTLLIAVGAAALFALCSPSHGRAEETLRVIALLPVPDASPSTKAFLEHYASQVAWMDSAVLRCVLLVYPEQPEEIRALCEDMSREYEFFIAVSVSGAQKIVGALV